MTKHSLLLVAALHLPAVIHSQALDPATLSGRWSGTGTFFKADLAEKLGPIPITLEFKSGELIAGTVGEARLGRVRATSARRLIQVSTRLTGRVSPAPELDKDYFVLLIIGVSDSSLKAEFHLKSNGIFDPRVREGRVTLTRADRKPASVDRRVRNRLRTRAGAQ